MNRDIYEITRLKKFISKKIEKSDISSSDTQALENLKNMIEGQEFFSLYNATDSFDDQEIIEHHLNEKIRREKIKFNKCLFNLENIFSKVDEKYKDTIIKAINEFLFEFISIKEKGNVDKKTILFQVAKIRKSKKNFSKNFFKEVKNYQKGLDTTILCEKLFDHIVMTDTMRSEMEKIKLKRIRYHKEIINNLIFNKNNFFEIQNEKSNYLLEVLLPLKLKFSSFSLEEISELFTVKNLSDFNDLKINYFFIKIENFNKSFQKNIINLERLKNFSYFSLEKKFLSAPHKAEEYKKNIKSLKIKIEAQKEIFRDFFNCNFSKINKEYYETKLNKKWKRRKFKDLEKLSTSEFIEILNEYIYIFLTEKGIKDSIKIKLANSLVGWLKFNDFITEIKLYIKIIEDIKKMSSKELKNKYNLNKFEKFLKKFKSIEFSEIATEELDFSLKDISISGYCEFIKEKKLEGNDENFQKYIQSLESSYFNTNIFDQGIIYEEKIKTNIIDYKAEDILKDDSEDNLKNDSKDNYKIERMQNYKELYTIYEKLLYFKFANIKIYLDSNFPTEDYFSEYYILMENFSNFLIDILKESEGFIEFLPEIMGLAFFSGEEYIL